MKTEQKQFLVALEAGLVCVVYGALYSIAGSQDFWGGQKWIRRFLDPSLFCIWAFLRSGFDWRYFVQLPFMIGALTLPYGSNDVGIKVLLRGLCGIGNGLAGSITNLWNGNYFLLSMAILISVIVSIIAGAFNPFHDPMIEQFIIGVAFIVIPAFSVQKKEAA